MVGRKIIYTAGRYARLEGLGYKKRAAIPVMSCKQFNRLLSLDSPCILCHRPGNLQTDRRLHEVVIRKLPYREASA